MVESIHVIYQGLEASNNWGYRDMNFNWDRITKKSAVLVSAAEWSPDRKRPNLGWASVFVTNVGTHDPEGGDRRGGVEFRLWMQQWFEGRGQPAAMKWDGPLSIIVTISVLGDVEDTINA